MPITPTYPGVYVEEVPSGVRTIIGVATSITAFVGRARKGPVNDPTTINSYADYERIFGGLWLKSSMSYAVRDFYVNGGRQAIIVRLHNGATASTITLGSASSPPGDLVLQAANVGTWGNNLSAHVDHETRDRSDQQMFNLTIYERDPETKAVVNVEKFINVTVDPNKALYVARVLEQRSQLVRVRKDNNDHDEVPGLRPSRTYAVASPPASPPAAETPQPVPATGGGDGADLKQDQFVDSREASPAGKTGLYALEKADLFNLLCIPPFTLDEDGDITSILIGKAAKYCQDRRAMLLIDAPADWRTKTTAVDTIKSPGVGVASESRKNAALFFPRLRQPNPLRDNQMEDFAPCGAVAGIFARTDAQRGVWKAPAGQEAGLAGVPELSVPLTDDENGELNPLGVNCLRAFPVYGRLVWGSRTLDGADQLASEWKYIPVRRMALYIEETLYRNTKWVVFEPNDEPLWAQIRLNISAFMHDLFRQGAFQGTTPRAAYLVKCDKETTTQYDIDRGIVNILVGFAPLKPAEFVFIKIQQLAQQTEA